MSHFRRERLEAVVRWGEFVRFFCVGIGATAGNLAVVWFSADIVDYKWALVFGVATGFLISFMGSKLFAFRVSSWRGVASETARFILVFSTGALLYWVVALAASKVLYPACLNQKLAQLAGAFLGASTMMLTSYLGHRFFTYRTHLR